MPGTAHDDDMLGRMVGEAGVVRDAFEQLPILLAALDGPDHRLAAMNAAYRSFTGRPDVLGVPYRDAFPGFVGNNQATVTQGLPTRRSPSRPSE